MRKIELQICKRNIHFGEIFKKIVFTTDHDGTNCVFWDLRFRIWIVSRINYLDDSFIKLHSYESFFIQLLIEIHLQKFIFFLANEGVICKNFVFCVEAANLRCWFEVMIWCLYIKQTSLHDGKIYFWIDVVCF